jgi:hypothetical protein
MRELVPWWARIGAKLVLSRAPVNYAFWRRLGIFQHGQMHHPAYALAAFREHFARAHVSPGTEFVALELGPGDSLASAIIAAAHGAKHTHLIDVGPYATMRLGAYHELCDYLRGQGLEPPDLSSVHDINSLLRVCHASYGTRGLDSLREVPAGSVDFIWSNAVLEHVRRGMFAEFIGETRRVVRSGGVCSHQIDLQDHLGGALNNLRLPSRWWEAEWMARSGFYTNRLRMSDIIRSFEQAGFRVRVLDTSCWSKLPTPRHALAAEFRAYECADLLVRSFAVTLSAA